MITHGSLGSICFRPSLKLINCFLKFKTLVETQFDNKIKCLQTDWGGEFRSLKPFLDKLGIVHRLSCPYTPQQNGRVERKNRHVVEVGLSMLAQSHVPISFWPYAFQYAVYLINRLPTPFLPHQSPFEIFYHRLSSYQSIRVFECSCFPFLRPYNSQKLQFRSSECVLLGISPHHKGYLYLSKHTGKIYVSRHVVFNEFFFPSICLTVNLPIYQLCSSLILYPYHTS